MKRVVCVSCPVGCEVTVEIAGNRVTRVEGHRCPRGEVHARQEAVEPLRVLTTSVKVLHGERPLVSVRTERPVPKRLIPRMMEELRNLSVEAPVEIGQTLVEDLCGTGVSVIATRTVARRAHHEPLDVGAGKSIILPKNSIESKGHAL